MSELRGSNEGRAGLLPRLLLRPWDLLLALFRRGGPAPVVVAEQKPQQDVDPRADYLAERHALVQTVKIAAITLGVLFVLNIEYTPMVIANDQLENRYSNQVRSLILVEGYVSRLNQSLANGLDAYRQRVVQQVERALGQVIALEDYDRKLATWGRTQGQESQGATPPAPEFLTFCATLDPEIAAFIKDPSQVHARWQDLVARCIIEPMDVDFSGDDEERIMPQLDDAQTAVAGAIADARSAFPQTESSQPEEFALAPSAASGTPTPVPTELTVHALLDTIETQVDQVVRVVERTPHLAVQPLPSNWLIQFTGEDGSLHSFRDNLLLAYSSPFGTKLVAANRSPLASIRVREAPDPFVTSTVSFTVLLSDKRQELNEPLSQVIDKQEALQDLQSERADEIRAAVPGVLQPVLAVARPKYLVLLYPLAVALVGAYLLSQYTWIQWKAAPVGAGDSPVLTVLMFLGLACAPIGVLLWLFRPYDWPQYADSWWFWMHRGPLLGLLAVVLACMIVLLRSSQCALQSRSRT